MPEISPSDLARVREWCRTYGSGNCWTGTSGSVAAVMIRLVEEYEQRQKEREAADQSTH